MSESREPDRVERFFGAALAAAGGLIFGLCGLCTLSSAGTSLVAAIAYHQPLLLGTVALSIAIGGLPTFGGFMLMRFGWRMYRGKPVPRPRPPAQSSDD